MGIIDIIILTILVVSVLISIMRGFVKEAMSLVIWILAIWVAVSYYSPLDAKLLTSIESSSIRVVTAFALLFLGTLIAGAIINRLLNVVVKQSGLSGTDRMLGIFFGMARGLLIVAVLVVLAKETELPKEKWWKESNFLGHFHELAGWLKKSCNNIDQCSKHLSQYSLNDRS
ncbi:Colicin V production protein [hydrothermal vent metagenome]|uniref:Colicin V production protein n=1 Tax=hydrothermal vent metagenome TaxID=652676 RepID=A0A3B0Y350_9ZZZZ